MLDRAIGIFGIALAIIFGVWSLAPEGWPKFPLWAMYTGIGTGIFFAGVSTGLIAAHLRGSSTIVSNVKPDIKLAMVGANVFEPDMASVHGMTGIALNAKIWNTGSPSVATDWSLFVLTKNTPPIRAQLTGIPDSLRVGGPVNSIVIRSSDSLEEKTKLIDLTQIPVYGYLLFYVKMKRQVVLSQGTIFELCVKDIFGKETKIEQRMSDWLQL